ncbi:DNA gyrase subunit A [Candidatus Micrarchaeota archaeon]|nr:DNA gyrase subunit A [Candidatus Micrarchaeota archaeon]
MAEKIVQRTIEDDMRESYVDYSMSVIIGRALPDVRDGLKPVHRRILYGMHELGNYHDKPHKKSARIVGEILGKFHPHGDMAIYDSLVRMAQPFSLRYVLVDGHGNMGSLDGDSAAAMRYTEVRMARLSNELLADIEKETVDFTPNFDGTLKEPTVLPSKIPNLLINGSSGIAVGMATNVPPHNLNEIVDATVAVIDGADEGAVIEMVKGPDFPTGGIIVGRAGILQAYKTGRGIIRLRGKAEIEQEKNKIVISEIPYQMTKTALIEAIVESAKSKRIEGISGINDYSDKKGLAITIDLKRGVNADVVLNQLYAHTPLESTFGIINLALVGKKPKLLPLHSMITEFIEFRKEVIRRKSVFELREAEERAHILEGLRIALQNIDSVVAFLRKSKDVSEARSGLMKQYSLSEKQANAILDMKLQRLIALEREKIETEYAELQKKIAWLKEVLADIKKILHMIKEELKEVKSRYGDERRTDIIEIEGEITTEALVPNNKVVVVISNRGYIKRVLLSEYRTQHRGGKGIVGTETKEEDFVKDAVITRNHNYLLFFTDKGRVHWLKTYQLPEAGRYASGKTIVSLLDLKEEKISSWISVAGEFSESEYLLMVTKKGIAKRTSLANFGRPRKGGIIAITLKEGDELIEVIRTTGNEDVVVATKDGQAIRFNETDARETGRTSQGVIGIRLREGDEVVGAAVCRKPSILTVTENGYGKRTHIDEYRSQARGGHGVINIKTEGRNGNVVGIAAVDDDDEAIVMSSHGQSIRTPVAGISVIGRNTQGVRIIKLGENEKVASITTALSEKKTEEEVQKEAEEKEAEVAPVPPSPEFKTPEELKAEEEEKKADEEGNGG